MNGRSMKLLRILAFLITVFGLAAPLGAELSDEGARDLAAQARELLSDGRYEQAVRLVSEAVEQCGRGTCQDRLDYTLGYLHDRQSLRVAGRADSVFLLERSAESYSAVLARHPAHRATLGRLFDVYARLGADEELEEILRRGLEASEDPDRRAELALALGELHSRLGRHHEAVDAYRVAVAAAPSKITPRRREAIASGRLLTGRASEVMDRMESWEDEFRGAARQGYQEILSRVWELDEATAERALLRWLATADFRADVLAEDVHRLPSDWRPARDLQAFVETPSAEHFAPWWFEQPDRRDAVAAFVLAVGRLQPRHSERALETWNAALDLEPPSPITTAWTELYSELASAID